MYHKPSYQQRSPGLSHSDRTLLNIDNSKLRRTNPSLQTLSPGSRRKHYSRSISVQDIMGGEKRATEILSPKRRASLVSPSSSHGSPSFMNAEEKIHGILEARELRQRRRSDICKSLDKASPVVEQGNSRRSFNGLENIIIPLNDKGDSPNRGERVGRRRRRSSIGGGGGKRSEMSHDQLLSMKKSLEESKKSKNTIPLLSPFTPTGMKRSGSASALANKLRQRLQGANYCDLNDSNHSKFEVDLKPSVYSCDTDDCTLSESDDYMETPKKDKKTRSKSRQRSRSKNPKKVSRRDSEEGEESKKKGRSKSKSRIRSKSKSKLKQKRRSSMTESERSETFDDPPSTSFTRRSLRRPKNLTEEASFASETSDVDASARSALSISARSAMSIESPRDAKSRHRRSQNSLDISNSSAESFASPGSFKAKKRTKNKKPSTNEEKLGFLLESGRKSRSMHNDDLSHVTEEKTVASADAPQFLQFDPTMSKHVRSVDQKKAKVTSASINGLHGMTPKLKIAEVSGLPTFEKKLDVSTSTATTVESLGSYVHNSSNNLFATIQKTPKKGTYRRSASMVNTSSPLVMPTDNFLETSNSKNAQWNLGPSSAHNSRSAGSAGMKMLLNNKKGAERPMRRGSLDSGFTRAARRNSLGNMMGIRGRYNDRTFGDGELLLSS